MSNAAEADVCMKKVVWTGAVAALVLVCLGAVPASAQDKPAQARARIEKRAGKKFKKLDRNGDGLIERSEWTCKPKAFDRVDADHDGTLSQEEFRRFVAKRLRHR